MEYICTYDNLWRKSVDLCEDIPITVGILIADLRQHYVREYIKNYLEVFGEKSGKFIKIFLAGHCDDSSNGESEYDKELFKSFVYKFEDSTGIEYFGCPMLVLMGVNKNYGYGKFEYQDYIVIQLDDMENNRLRHSGTIFKEIFKIAKTEVDIKSFDEKLRSTYVKKYIKKELIRVLKSTLEDAIKGKISQEMLFYILLGFQNRNFFKYGL